MDNSQKIKVLQLVWRFDTGGAENMVVAFHNYFTSNSLVDIKTLSFTPSKGEIWERVLRCENVDYIPKFWAESFPVKLRKFLRFIFYKQYRRKWLKQSILSFDPDIIHVHMANLAAEMYDVLKSLPPNVKVVYHLHSMPETITPDRVKILRKAISTQKYIPVCVTRLQRESANFIYGVSTDAVIVYNGINIHRFLDTKLNSEDISILKSKYKISQGQVVVGCVGRGAPVKNYPLLAKAVGELSKNRDVALLIVGNIDEQLKNKIMQLSGRANVVFTGSVSNTNELYRIMDVFVLPSFHESSSIVSVEAQLSGLSCVLSDSISDEVVISDGVVKLSPYRSAIEWASAIESQIEKSINIYDFERFDFEKNAMRLYNFYNKIIGYDKK